jgi:hypothetical protein
MEGARTYARDIRKPKVLLSNDQFPFVTEKDVGDHGVMDAGLIVESIKLERDDDGNDMRMITMVILNATGSEVRDARIK